MTKTTKNDKGFTIVVALLCILVLTVLGFGGYEIWHRHQQISAKNASQDSSAGAYSSSAFYKRVDGAKIPAGWQIAVKVSDTVTIDSAAPRGCSVDITSVKDSSARAAAAAAFIEQHRTHEQRLAPTSHLLPAMTLNLNTTTGTKTIPQYLFETQGGGDGPGAATRHAEAFIVRDGSYIKIGEVCNGAEALPPEADTAVQAVQIMW